MSGVDEVPPELARWVVGAVERELAGDEPSSLALHVEGALPPDEAARVDALAAQEPAVAARLAALRAALPERVTLPPVAVPGSLRAFALAAVRAELRSPPRRPPLVVGLALGAFGLVAGALLGAALGARPAPAPSAPTSAPPPTARPTPTTAPPPPPPPALERLERLEARASELGAELERSRADEAAARAELAAARSRRDELAAEAARLGAALDEAQALARRRAADELARPAPELTDRTVVRVRGVERWDPTGRAWRALAAGDLLAGGEILRGVERRNDLELPAGATLLGQGLYVVGADAVRPVPLLELGREPVVGPPGPERTPRGDGWQRLAWRLGGGR